MPQNFLVSSQALAGGPSREEAQDWGCAPAPGAERMSVEPGVPRGPGGHSGREVGLQPWPSAVDRRD